MFVIDILKDPDYVALPLQRYELQSYEGYVKGKTLYVI